MKQVLEKLKELGLTPLDTQDELVSLWDQFYKGHVKDFHSYKEYQGAALGQVNRTRESLGMAKTVAARWADNIINPETQFFIDDDIQQTWLEEYFEENNVVARLNNLMEISFALGTGATVQYYDGTKNINQYMSVEKIIPLGVYNGEVIDCAFYSKIDEETYSIQTHLLMSNGKYQINNYFVDKDGKDVVMEGYEDEMISDVKLFQLYSPAIVNNLNRNTALGLSIYANAIHELKGVDLGYDAVIKEVKNGRMRVYVQGEALHRIEGQERPVFDSEQDEFFILPEDATNEDGTLITVSAPTLRVNDLIDNLNKQINLLGTKCGLGDNAFYSQEGTIYTNTEQVISTNSTFYKTREKHVTAIENSLIQMIQALYYLEHGTVLETNVRVDFDDSIIHDKDKEYERSMMLYNLGLISSIQLYQDIMGLTEDEAIEFNKKQIEQMDLKEDEGEPEGGEV